MMPAPLVPKEDAPDRGASRKLAYTIGEAVAVSGLSRSFIYERIRDQTLPAVKAGARTLILEPALRTFLGTLPPIGAEKQKPRAT